MRVNGMSRVLMTLALVAVSGCSKFEGTPPAAGGGPAGPPSTAATVRTLEPAPAAATTPAASVAAPAATQAIATAEGETSGLRVEVLELKRGSDTVMLKFALINDQNADFSPGAMLGGVTGGYNTSGIYLVDSPNKKKYLVLVDSQQKCVCSEDLSTVKPKSRMNLWAKFPAPPADVKRISVIFPHFAPMDDVVIGGS
jgi:hypothetical protein